MYVCMDGWREGGEGVRERVEIGSHNEVREGRGREGSLTRALVETNEHECSSAKARPSSSVTASWPSLLAATIILTTEGLLLSTS